MGQFNQVILMGNLTRQPELNYTPGQTAVVSFGMAVNRKWTDQGGTQREEVCFVECVMFGKRAEAFNKYMSKGSPVFVQGRLKFESWESEGKKHQRLKVLAESFEFVGKKDD